MTQSTHKPLPHVGALRYNQNLGSLMTIWDRLFGTYINPDDIDGELKYGLENTPSLWRMVLGVD